MARRRPADLLAPTTRAVVLTPSGDPAATPQPAPYAALLAELDAPTGRVDLSLTGADARLTGWWDAGSGRTGLTVDDGRSTEHPRAAGGAGA